MTKRKASNRGPLYYADMKVQPFDVMNSMGGDILDGYLVGASIKYIMRMGKKGSWREDIKKAIHCLEILLEVNPDEGG
jgi:hypothetical protein